MTRLTDGNATAEINMMVWQGDHYSPDFSADFFEVGNSEKVWVDKANDFAYKVKDILYCVDMAQEWRDSIGDFAGDEPNENNTVFVNYL